MTFLPAVKNSDGALVNLAAYNNGTDIVLGELEYDYLCAYLSGISDKECEASFLVDGNGNIIVSSVEIDEKMNINDNFVFKNTVSKLGNSDFFNDHSDSLNGKSMVFSKEVMDSRLYMVYAAGYSKLFSSYYLLMALLIAVFVVCITVSITASYIASKKVTQPVSDTANRLLQLAGGDVSSPCKRNNRNDETQVLADSLADTVDNLSAYIKDIDYVLSEISRGNLSVSSCVEYKGDFIGIKNSLDDIKENISNTMTQINATETDVQNGADSIYSATQLLAENVRNEASEIEEITSKTRAIFSDAEATNNETSKALKIVESVMEGISDGGKTVQEMSESMLEIKNTSDKIQQIVGMIEDIAFQTNILALNAAVEAARAGSAGKGFAVVADEVRTLAARSSEASKNTMELIEKSAAAVEKGTDISAKTEYSFKSIENSVSEFAGLIENISQASSKQTNAIDEINSGIENITKIVQSNSDSAQKSAASCSKLKEQADILRQEVSKFQI